MLAQADGSSPRTYTNTGGRPLGMDFAPAGDLIVADAVKGLLSVSRDGAVSVLATGEGGVPFRFTNDVDVGPDGVIYFSDASSKYAPPEADRWEFVFVPEDSY